VRSNRSCLFISVTVAGENPGLSFGLNLCLGLSPRLGLVRLMLGLGLDLGFCRELCQRLGLFQCSGKGELI
jgi:hypothetical protein